MSEIIFLIMVPMFRFGVRENRQTKSKEGLGVCRSIFFSSVGAPAVKVSPEGWRLQRGENYICIENHDITTAEPLFHSVSV